MAFIYNILMELQGIVEAPFEHIKVRRQVGQNWKFIDIFNGSQATIMRNSILFCSVSIILV